MLSLDISTLTKQGSRRYQEDNFGEAQVAGVWCLIVADGAGGHGGGHIASELAVRASLDAFAQHPDFSADRLHQTLLHAHRVVKAGQQKFERYPDMRSTLVIALVDLASGRVMLGNIGDSRGYAYVGGEVARTRDHTIMQQMIDAGMYKPGEAPRSRVTSTLMASLGSADDPAPFVIELPTRCSAGDCFLLCTDGWWDTLDPDRLMDTLLPEQALADALAALEGQLLLQASADQDNYTALLARVTGVPEAVSSASAVAAAAIATLAPIPTLDKEGTVPLAMLKPGQPPGWEDTVIVPIPLVPIPMVPIPPLAPVVQLDMHGLKQSDVARGKATLHETTAKTAAAVAVQPSTELDFDRTVILKRQPDHATPAAETPSEG